jgi:hypothetical protein
MSKLPYVMREDAVTGKIFYDNLLADKQYERTYFPPMSKETGTSYGQRNKVAVPIAKGAINRIANIIIKDTVISSPKKEIELLIEELDKKVHILELYRDMIVNTLSTGNNLILVRPNIIPDIEFWTGEYIIISGNLIGIQYNIEDDLIKPVMSEDDIDKDTVTKYIDSLYWGDVEHNFGYDPSVFTANIDKYTSNRSYGKSYIKRFDDLIKNYNQVFSKMLDDIKIFSNVWATNRAIDNPDIPVTVTPYQIQFLGPDGVLEQVARQIDFKPEMHVLERLEFQISQASSVPSELYGLKDAGKLPSGIALQALMQPLEELIARMSNMFIPSLNELVEILIQSVFVSNGKEPPQDVEIEIQTDNRIFIEDDLDVITKMERLKNLLPNVVNEETIKRLIEPYIHLEGE